MPFTVMGLPTAGKSQGILGMHFATNATPAIHALYFGVFANTNIGVAVGCFGDLCDEPTHGSV
jgi:hypothetical protein